MQKADDATRLTIPALAEVVYNCDGIQTKKAAREAVDAVFDAIRESLVAGRTVQIAGLGTFTSRATPARTGRNPTTGRQETFPPTRRVGFSTSTVLRQTLREVSAPPTKGKAGRKGRAVAEDRASVP